MPANPPAYSLRSFPPGGSALLRKCFPRRLPPYTPRSPPNTLCRIFSQSSALSLRPRLLPKVWATPCHRTSCAIPCSTATLLCPFGRIQKTFHSTSARLLFLRRPSEPPPRAGGNSPSRTECPEGRPF